MHHKKVPCFNPHCVFGVNGNIERPTDYERAASLTQDTQLAIEDDMLHLKRQQSNTWIAHLEELGNDDEQFCRDSQILLEMLHRITVMDGGAPELLEKLFGLLRLSISSDIWESRQNCSSSFPSSSR